MENKESQKVALVFSVIVSLLLVVLLAFFFVQNRNKNNTPINNYSSSSSYNPFVRYVYSLSSGTFSYELQSGEILVVAAESFSVNGQKYNGNLALFEAPRTYLVEFMNGGVVVVPQGKADQFKSYNLAKVSLITNKSMVYTYRFLPVFDDKDITFEKNDNELLLILPLQKTAERAFLVEMRNFEGKVDAFYENNALIFQIKKEDFINAMQSIRNK